MADITHILSELEKGDPCAAHQLLPMVYRELRCLAAQRLALEKPGHTLQATALVHEAYLRLVNVNAAGSKRCWDNRAHFFSAAAEAMRRILVENARRRATLKYGGGIRRIPLAHVVAVEKDHTIDVLAIDEALSTLELHDPQAAALVKLRYCAGFGHQEAASALGLSRRSADRLWEIAKTWLYQQLAEKSEKCT